MYRCLVQIRGQIQHSENHYTSSSCRHTVQLDLYGSPSVKNLGEGERMQTDIRSVLETIFDATRSVPILFYV